MNLTHLLIRMSTGRPWEMYSTMTVQKDSVFQWSGNFSHPPSAIENEDLNTLDLISKGSAETRKKQLQHNQNKCLVTRKCETQVGLWARK